MSVWCDCLRPLTSSEHSAALPSHIHHSILQVKHKLGLASPPREYCFDKLIVSLGTQNLCNKLLCSSLPEIDSVSSSYHYNQSQLSSHWITSKPKHTIICVFFLHWALLPKYRLWSRWDANLGNWRLLREQGQDGHPPKEFIKTPASYKYLICLKSVKGIWSALNAWQAGEATGSGY